MRKSIYFLAATFVSTFLFAQSSSADLLYYVAPQELEHETEYTTEFIYGGTITMVDGADADGILVKEEIIEARIQNSMSGEVYAYDQYDFTNVNAQFIGNDLVGQMRIQHTNSGEAFIDWGNGDLVSISDEHLQEYAQAPWSSSNVIATRAVPEPTACFMILPAAAFALSRRKRKA